MKARTGRMLVWNSSGAEETRSEREQNETVGFPLRNTLGGAEFRSISQLFVHSSSPPVYRCLLAKSKDDACVVTEVVLVVIPSGNERVPKTGKQIIHLERANRYCLVYSDVESSANGHGKGVVTGTYTGTRCLI